MTAYNVTFGAETTRLISDLRAINPELAEQLSERCLGREPSEVSGRLRRVLMNVL